MKATFYAALILSLVAVCIGTQQGVALYRLGGHESGLDKLQKLLKNNKNHVSKSQLYIWQLPVTILIASILFFLIGLLIMIWNQAAEQLAWNDGMKVGAYCEKAAYLANFEIDSICCKSSGTLWPC